MLSVAVCDCLWLSVAFCGCLSLFVAVCGCLWLSMAFEAASEKRLGRSLKHLDTCWKHPKASWNVIKACFIEVLSYRHAQHTVFYRVR